MMSEVGTGISISEIRTILAPTGTLRVGLNMANKLLVSGAEPDGAPAGVSPDLGKAIADRLGVPVAYVCYPSPGAVADAAAKGEWDLGNIGDEPERALTIAFTKPYCEIEATCLVPGSSPLNDAGEIDQHGIRIAVKARTAYGLWLERNIKKADLVLIDPARDPFDVFRQGDFDALAGLRKNLERSCASYPDGRVLDGHFMTVRQAVGTPKANAAALPWLEETVADLKRSGVIAELIARHGIEGLTVPAA